MFLNPALSAALDRISERAEDVRRAFTPGAVARYDDVATARASSDFTLDPLAVTAADGLYFVTRNERGEVSYTRDGSLTLRNGRLVNGEGEPIRGFAASSNDLSDLRIDAVDEALGRASDPQIERDGSFVYRAQHRRPTQWIAQDAARRRRPHRTGAFSGRHPFSRRRTAVVASLLPVCSLNWPSLETRTFRRYSRCIASEAALTSTKVSSSSTTPILLLTRFGRPSRPREMSARLLWIS